MQKSETRSDTVGNAGDEAEALPLSEELLHVDKRRVPTGRVRVHTKADVANQLVSQELKAEQLDVCRVPINSYVEEAPSIRTEGDVTIIPILEEVLVVETKLLLKEELRVRRVVTTETVSATIPVRKQRLVVESDADE
jgi:stress response protein YsnF